jgi:hypothetical protein
MLLVRVLKFLDAIIKANDGDSTPYGNDQISTELQDKFSEIFEKEVIRFSNCIRYCSKCLGTINNDSIIWKHLLS